MSARHEVRRASLIRAALHLVAVFTMLAALSALAPQEAAAKKKASHKAKTESTAKHAAKVDLNTANVTDLEELPGVGTVMAQQIMAGRPYKSLADLKHAGIPANTIAGLKGRVTVSRIKTETPARTAKREPSKRAPAATTVAERPAAHSAAKSKTGQRTFFGIPIGAPEKKQTPETKETPRAEERASTSSPTSAEVAAPRQEPPSKGMVWVNTDSKVYHVEGDRWYGATRHGKWMWEDQAVRDGFRASKQTAK